MTGTTACLHLRNLNRPSLLARNESRLTIPGQGLGQLRLRQSPGRTIHTACRTILPVRSLGSRSASATTVRQTTVKIDAPYLQNHLIARGLSSTSQLRSQATAEQRVDENEPEVSETPSYSIPGIFGLQSLVANPKGSTLESEQLAPETESVEIEPKRQILKSADLFSESNFPSPESADQAHSEFFDQLVRSGIVTERVLKTSEDKFTYGCHVGPKKNGMYFGIHVKADTTVCEAPGAYAFP